jgi:hypothetical protein
VRQPRSGDIELGSLKRYAAAPRLVRIVSRYPALTRLGYRDVATPRLKSGPKLLCQRNRGVDALSNDGWQGGELLRSPAPNGEL